MDDVSYDDARANDNDIPLIRFAEVLLNYAEAKVEPSTLTDEGWAKTIGALRMRVGITGGTPTIETLTMKLTSPEPHIAAYYPDVDDAIILEVRCERAIELCLEGFRINDLKRWNCAHLWADDPWEGVYIPALNTPLDMNGDGEADIYFYQTDKIDGARYAPIGIYVGTKKNNVLNMVQAGSGYLFKYNIKGRGRPARQYPYPIPEVVIQKNNNPHQNPGWQKLEY